MRSWPPPVRPAYSSSSSFSPNSITCERKASGGGALIQRTASQSGRAAEHNTRAKSAGKTPAALLCALVMASCRERPFWQQKPQISARSFGSSRSSRAVTLFARMVSAVFGMLFREPLDEKVHPALAAAGTDAPAPARPVPDQFRETDQAGDLRVGGVFQHTPRG